MLRQRLPQRWYSTRPPSLPLRAAALLYEVVTRMRRTSYALGIVRSTTLRVPVVVVGNIAVGGTGKTPLTLWLAEGLTSAGYRPGIVCRSYGGHVRCAVAVGAGADPRRMGDEAVFMASRASCPVWSGPKRAQTAAAMTSAHPEVDVVLCDDGLQHYALARTVEIAVVDATRGFGNGHLLPAGPLREPVERLRSVEAIVLNGEAAVTGLPDTVPTYRMALRGERFVRVGHPGHVRPAGEFAGGRIAAIAGIGHPERFFEHLRSLGLTFTAKAFPDHHDYVPGDLAALEADYVLMTEKDAIKCARFADERMWMLPVSADVEAALLERLLNRLCAPPHP